MLFLLFGSLFVLQHALAVQFNSSITTTSDSALISVKSDRECCCYYILKFYLNLTDAYSACSENQNCLNCETFSINLLYPKTKYIFTYTYPNKTFTTVMLVTEPLDVALAVRPTSSTATVTATYSTHFRVDECSFILYDDSSVIQYCTTDCGDCSTRTLHGLIPQTQYILNYWNQFIKSSANISFTTKTSIFNVIVAPGYTNASFEISSSVEYYSNCNADLQEYPNKSVLFDCLHLPGCSSCGTFTITNLIPKTAYILTYTFNNRKEIREIYFKTYYTYLTQSFYQESVDLIKVIVYNMHTIPGTFHCLVTIVSDHAKCREPCPTNCTSYYIEVTNLDPFSLTLSSSEAVKANKITLQPLKYQFRITSHYIDGHTINVGFTPNMKGGKNCTLKVFAEGEQIPYNCTGGICPNDCDNLKYSLEGINIDTTVSFTISNKYIKEENMLELNLISDVTLDETLLTTATTVDVSVYHGGHCCCNATVRGKYNAQTYIENCQNNDACFNCTSFTLTGLVANSQYLLLFTITDGIVIERAFKTKAETIMVTTHSSNTEIDISIASDVFMAVGECTIKLYDSNGYSVFYCHYYCQSCSSQSFYALRPGESYKFVFESVFLANNYEKIITTRPMSIDATVSYLTSFIFVNISIKINGSSSEVCDVRVMNMETDKKVPFSCYYIPGCRTCKNFTISNLIAYTEYAVIVRFENSGDEISERMYTKYISINQNYVHQSVNEIDVKVSLFGYEPDEYKCSIQLSSPSATCNLCPTNCTNYKIRITSFGEFTASVSSTYAYSTSIINIKPKIFSIKNDYATYDGVTLLVKLQPNLKDAGLCILEGYDGQIKIDIKCNKKDCSVSCDNLTLSITGIHHNINFTLKVSNQYLAAPEVFPIKLQRFIMMDKELKITSTTAFIQIIGGNTCCCSIKVTSKYPTVTIANYCNKNYNCKMCRSFYMEDLIPDKYYYLTFLTPSGVETSLSFKTDYLHIKLKYYISFTSVEITVLNELGHDMNPTKCSSSLRLLSDYISSCYGKCTNCTFLKYNNLEANTSYSIYYSNYYAYTSDYYTFTTLDISGTYPMLLDAAQLDYRNIYIAIDNVTIVEYTGSYDIYAVEDESIEFHIKNQAPVLKGLFKKDVNSLTVDLDLHFKIYMVVICFDIYHKNCTDYPDDYYCLICHQKQLRVCSQALLYFTKGEFQYDFEKKEMMVSHSLDALTCHESLHCYVTFIFLMKKYVSLNALDHDPDRKNYYTNGMGVNYLQSLNDTECRKVKFVISEKDTFSEKSFISIKGVYYTISFVTCNTIACFPSMLYNNLLVQDSSFVDIVVFAIIILISAILLAGSIKVLLQYSSEKSLGDDNAYEDRKQSAGILSSDGNLGESNFTQNTANLRLATSA